MTKCSDSNTRSLLRETSDHLISRQDEVTVVATQNYPEWLQLSTLDLQVRWSLIYWISTRTKGDTQERCGWLR